MRAKLKSPTQRRHDEDDIDIRRQQLRATFACCLADQSAGPWQNCLDDGRAFAHGNTYRHEIADARQV